MIGRSSDPRGPVVLLPGMMCDERQWVWQVKALRGDGYDVSVGDLTTHSSVAELAEAVLAAAPPTFALAGLSMGGIVALALWCVAPERVTHLALLDTNPYAESPARQALRAGEIELAMAHGVREQFVESMKPRYLADSRRKDQALRDEILAMALDLGPDVFRRQSIALRDRPDRVAILSSIRVPTLVLCGREDSLCPLEYHLRMAECIPTADLQVLADCGHLSPMERPEAVNAALRTWLAR